MSATQHFWSVTAKTAFAAVSTGKAGTCFKANKQKTKTHPSFPEKNSLRRWWWFLVIGSGFPATRYRTETNGESNSYDIKKQQLGMMHKYNTTRKKMQKSNDDMIRKDSASIHRPEISQWFWKTIYHSHSSCLDVGTSHRVCAHGLSLSWAKKKWDVSNTFVFQIGWYWMQSLLCFHYVFCC